MTVFDSSSPYVYAQRQSIPFILYSDVEVECAVGYENTYTDDNINDSYTYIFTSDSDGKYNFYTRGDCDVTAVLTDKNKRRYFKFRQKHLHFIRFKGERKL